MVIKDSIIAGVDGTHLIKKEHHKNDTPISNTTPRKLVISIKKSIYHRLSLRIKRITGTIKNLLIVLHFS